MKMLALALCLGLSTTALADTTATPLTAQQSRMADCNKQASGKKGDDRKAFMKTCLSGQAPAPVAVDKNGKPLTAQQIKMKNCAAANKGKKGDDYKTAQAACMSK